MDKKEALSLIKQVCQAYRGNLQEHQALQKAVQVVEELLTPKKK